MAVSRAHLRLAALVLILASLAASAAGDGQKQRLEYQVKAAMLYNFAAFVEWPRGTLDKPGQPLVVGSLGNDAFVDVLADMIRGESVQGHPVEVRRFEKLGDLSLCHLLFITDEMQPSLPQVLAVVERVGGVLTVGNGDQFTAEGGVIGFIREGNKVRFEVNVAAAERGGFKISSKLLRLARIRNGQ